MHSFSRMLWKEYRSLRLLWVGCVLGTVSLWGILVLMTLARGNAYQSDEYLFLIWTLATWLPSIYIIGCNAALYAGEREERTAEWLTNMAVPFRPLLAAKLAWPVLSGIAMQFVLVGGALAVQASIAGRNSAAGWSTMNSFLDELPQIASFALVESLVLSWFWSLQCARPLTAAAASAVSLIIINAFCGSFLLPPVTPDGWRVSDLLFGPWGVLRSLLALALLVVNAELTRSWLAGRRIAWSLPRLRTPRSRRVAEIVPELSTAWRREWQRFHWLEWQSIRIVLRVVAVAAAILGVMYLGWRNENNLSFNSVWLMFLVYFLPLIAGLAAWSGEQTRQQFRFFVNRGVSPVSLWLNKFAMWLAAMFTGILLLFTVVAAGWYFGLKWQNSQPLQDAMWARLNQATNGWPPAHFYAWSLTTLFCSSFAAALYFRRPILAIGAAFLMHIVLSIWFTTAYQLRLPVWVGIVPVAAWLVWCSLRQLPRWALERTGWRPMASIAADWCVFPVVFVAGVTAYWIYAVPNPDLDDFAHRHSFSASYQFPDAALTDWKPVRDQSDRLVRRSEDLWWEVLQKKAADTAATPIEAGNAAPDEAIAGGDGAVNGQSIAAQREALAQRFPDEQWSQLADDVRQFRDTILSRQGMTAAAGQAGRGIGVHESTVLATPALLLQLAEQDLLVHDEVSSERAARAAVRYAGVMFADAPLLTSITVKSLLHRNLHDQLIAWAEHPDNSPETIALLLGNIESAEMRWWITDFVSLQAPAKESKTEMDRRMAQAGWYGVLAWPEVVRQRRQMATGIANLHRFQWFTPITQRNFGAFPPAPVYRDNLLLPLSAYDRAWNYRDPQNNQYGMGGTIPPHVPWGLSNEAVTQLWDRETRLRCTCAALAAIAYRRTHGELPRSLADAAAEFATPSLLVDPWTGELLRVEPRGMAHDLIDFGTHVKLADAETPFVWSRGPDLAMFTQFERDRPQQLHGTHFFSGMRTRAARYVFPLPVRKIPDAMLPENGPRAN